MSVTLHPGTPCPDLDRLIDDALTGSSEAQRRLDAHVAGCAACIEEACGADAADDDLADCLAPLREETCPPALIEAALATARAASQRHAPDRRAERPARAASRRWRVGALAAALLALAASVVWLRTDLERPVAENTPPPPTLETPVPGDADEPPLVAGLAQPVPPTVSRAPSPAPAPRVTPARRAPEPRTTAAVPERIAAVVPTPEPTAADTAAAIAGAQLAFALIGRAQQEAALAVAPELRRPQAALEFAHVL